MPALLIGTYFRRPNAPIELPNDDGTFTSYFFRPIDPRNPASEHVATVTDPAHQERLLSITEGYYRSEAQSVVESAVSAAASFAKPRPNTTATDQPSDRVESSDALQAIDDVAQHDPPRAEAPPIDDDQAVKSLLGLSLRAFRAELPNTPQSVLRAALLAEAARGDAERPTYTKALREALKAG